MQEAGTRAIEADEQQRHADAVKLYKKALEIVSEGLALNVPSSGLSAKADNVASWKQQLSSWQTSIQERWGRHAELVVGSFSLLWSCPTGWLDSCCIQSIAGVTAASPQLCICLGSFHPTSFTCTRKHYCKH